MTMYLPNGDIRPTGDEAGEFLEDPTVASPAGATAGVEREDADDEGGVA